MKKIISLILALVMVMGLAVSASAATITITAPAADGNIAGETYTAYKVFSGSFSDDGEGKVYTISESDPFYAVVAAETELFTLTAVPGSETEYYVTAVEGATGDDIAEALNASTTKGTGIESVYADGEYTITIDEGEDGYYLITSSFGSGLIVDTVGKDGVTVEPKNEFPSLTKVIVNKNNEDVTSVTADRGSEITFKITVTVPATVNANIIIHDTLDVDMTYVADSVEGTGVSYAAGCGIEGCTDLHFEIDYEEVVGGTATFTYKATLNADAATATAHTNVAKLTYSAFTSTATTAVSVYTYEVDVYKWTGTEESQTGLEGAGFKLKNEDGKYYTNTNGVVTWTDAGTELTTSEANDFTVNFAGIAAGTYTLEESTVPEGYNKANDIPVTVSNANLKGESQIEVENKTGSELPSTGGIGTTLFYVIGGLLMAGAVVVLITKKRMA